MHQRVCHVGLPRPMLAPMQRFRDKVAVITGGSSGIGLAIAQRLREEGAKLVLFARSEDALVDAAQKLGAGVLTVAGDVGETADLERLFEETRRAFGRVDVLVPNAGVAEFVRVGEITEDHFERLFRVNVRGVLFSVQKALPLMSAGSSVVLVSSVANRVGVGQTAVYAATKAAVRSFARTLANELQPLGIRVNAVSPGPTESAIHAKYARGMTSVNLEAMSQETLPRLKLGRLARAEEVAAAIAFLASSEASFVLGQELSVDGGISAL
jgi:NAD(P)-dependent dehydrogenase (short-subunit alcohol dehydrogenase family)